MFICRVVKNLLILALMLIVTAAFVALCHYFWWVFPLVIFLTGAICITLMLDANNDHHR